MNWTRLFLSPNGRIPARPFWTGVAVLAPINVLAAVGALLAPPHLQSLIGLLGWLTVYSWLCVCGKRLHDSGRTAAWVLLPVGAVFFVGAAVSLVVMMPIMSEAMQTAMTDPHAPPPGLETYGPGTPAYAAARQASLIGIALGWAIYAAFLLWVGAGRHDLDTNRFGPAEDATARN